MVALNSTTLARAKERTQFRVFKAAAALHRTVLRNPSLVGVTGSCGKSTTTQLTAAVLGQTGNVYDGSVVDASNDNLRIALSVLHTKPSDTYCVIELSGHTEGALTYAAERLRIDTAIVTHIRSDHRSEFDGIDAVVAEKGRLVRALRPDGLAILNTDDPNVWGMRELTDACVFGCGRAEHADLRLVDSRAAWPDCLQLELEYQGARATVRTRFLSSTAEFPVLAAIAAGLTAGVGLGEAIAAVEAVEPAPGRMKPHSVGGATMVDDTWKSPLYSAESAIEWLGEATAIRKVLVLGTVSDSSTSKSKIYRRLSRRALDAADLVIVVGDWAHSASAVGDEARKKGSPSRLLTFETTHEAHQHLARELSAGDLVLLKGSCRADHLERLVLAQQHAVGCWTQTCGKPMRCEGCDLLGAGPG